MAYEFFNEWAPKFMGLLIEDFDLSVEDSAAVIGNAGHESAGFKSLQEIKPLVPGSKGGYGIMQWTGPRRRDFESYCKRNSLVPSDMMTNYKFLFVELKGPEGRVISKLKAAKGLNAKTKVFSDTFLRPGIPHMDSRYVWAQRALDAYSRSAGESQASVSEPPKGIIQEESNASLWSVLIKLLLKLLGK